MRAGPPFFRLRPKVIYGRHHRVRCIIAMFPVVILPLAAACPPSLAPIPVTVTRIEGEQLGARRDPAATDEYRVGVFRYRGRGIAERSDDPRYRELALDQQTGLRHRCGNTIFARSGWDAPSDRPMATTITIYERILPDVPNKGATEAGKVGAAPRLTGYRSIATWPAYSGGSNFFLGLMRPDDGAMKTVIVAFRNFPAPTPALVLADLPMVFQTISLLPDLHGPDIFLNLEALDERERRQVVLAFDDREAAAILARLAPAGQADR